MMRIMGMIGAGCVLLAVLIWAASFILTIVIDILDAMDDKP